MTRFTWIALALSAVFMTACTEGGSETSFVSEAVASPVNSKDYGWRSNGAPAAQAEGSVVEYY
ncbi:MAG TPA: hypothetical protein VM183_16280 [Burkholderiales bacterium]|nr:hypothetical protein [Burkholderiales bacterium]